MNLTRFMANVKKNPKNYFELAFDITWKIAFHPLPHPPPSRGRGWVGGIFVVRR
jgi:hypothetical protein